MTTKQTTRYIRLNPTTWYRVPGCYGKSEPDPLSDACIYCFLRKPCGERLEVIWK